MVHMQQSQQAAEDEDAKDANSMSPPFEGKLSVDHILWTEQSTEMCDGLISDKGRLAR
jgi:hypothetical protein